MIEIPVIDLFAGPGGLGEGFLSYAEEGFKYSIPLSIEMELTARNTLKLRKFFHQFRDRKVPEEYYSFLQQKISLEELYNQFPEQADTADQAAWHAELGNIDEEELDLRISSSIPKKKPWVLIGGPPCQAYSVIGRSRVNGINPDDHRVFLYQEYLKILAKYSPSIFVMENVPGLLSAKVNGHSIIDQIIADLSKPKEALHWGAGLSYKVYSLVKNENDQDVFGGIVYNPKDFIVRMEKYGIPQKRHRVILYGVREDFVPNEFPSLSEKAEVHTSSVLSDLPRIRSGMTKVYDTKKTWIDTMNNIVTHIKKTCPEVHPNRKKAGVAIRGPQNDRGGLYISAINKQDVQYNAEWYGDERLGGVCNHESKAHMNSDLFRYYFASMFAQRNGISPKLQDFPEELLPSHKNAATKKKNYAFADRFRVQTRNRPSTTITSHIAKDGHYYIHYDPTQCRSLTVREAARLQTFPDNYFFSGSRTDQYRQVGNAVPPLLALQIAKITAYILKKS